MGSIFRAASSVLAWLGTSPRTISFLCAVRENPTKYLSWQEFEDLAPTANPAVFHAEVERDVKENGLILASPEYWKRADERYKYVHELFEQTSIDTDLVIAFEGLEYWNRAWITQELILAARLVLLAGEEETEYKVIEGRNKVFHISHAVARSSYAGEGLAPLLLKFGEKKCWMVRDRVFSLLGVCAETMEVDYQSNDVEVFVKTLRALGGQGCLCTAAIVVEALEIGVDAIAIDVPTPRFEICLSPVDIEESWGRPDREFIFSCTIISEKHIH
jgi:hypothetical protein